jgi:hypothetical protein
MVSGLSFWLQQQEVCMYHPYAQSRSSGLPARWIAIFLALALMVSTLPFTGSFSSSQDLALPALSTADMAGPVTVPTASDAAEVGEPFSLSDLNDRPLSFVPNHGQSDMQVHFQAEVLGGQAFFTRDRVVLNLPLPAQFLADTASGSGNATVQMQFHGSNPTPNIQGGKMQAGHTNYLYGADPARWVTHVPNYGAITYKQLYPGISLRYDGQVSTLKGTYTVAPGANPASIRWSYAGASSVSVDRATGNLHILPAGSAAPLIEHAPIAWQVIDGKHVPVAARYTLAANGSIGFALGNYNPAHELIIDPAVTFVAFVAANNAESVYGVAVDPDEGFVYLTGRTSSSEFEVLNPLPGNIGEKKGSSNDIFVRKIDASTNELVYSTFMGGSDDDQAFAIALGAKGNAYITGHTKSALKLAEVTNPGDADYFATSFPITPTVVVSDEVVAEQSAFGYQLDGPDAGSLKGDAFVAKLSPDGSDLVYSTYIGGKGEDNGRDIDVYTFNHAVYGPDTEYAYITGDTDSEDFPIWHHLPGTLNQRGPKDAFVTVVGYEGKDIINSTLIGGSFTDIGHGIRVQGTTSNPSIYVTGQTNSADMFASPNITYTTHPVRPTINDGSGSNENDAFVTKIISASGSLSYTLSTYLGGEGADTGTGIEVDPAGDIYVTGSTDSSDFFGQGDTPFQAGLSGGTDAFVTKLNGDDGTIALSTYVGGSEDDVANGIAVDSEKHIYITGSSAGGNYPLVEPLPQQPTYAGGDADAFVTKIMSTTEALIYSTFFGGGGADIGNDIVVQGEGDEAFAFIAGNTTSGLLPGLAQDQRISGNHGFIAKLGPPRLFFAGYDTDPNNPALNVRRPKPVAESFASVPLLATVTFTSSTDYDISFSTRACADATAGEDFAQSSKEETLLARTNMVTFTLEIIDDNDDEVNEEFCVDVSSGFGETQTITVTIGDNDGPTVYFADNQATVNVDEPSPQTEEPALSATEATLNVRLNASSPQTITLPIRKVPGSAANEDFTLPDADADGNVMLTFGPGQTEAPFTVQASADGAIPVKELTEQGFLVIGDPELDDTPLFNLDADDTTYPESDRQINNEEYPEHQLHMAFPIGTEGANPNVTGSMTSTLVINDPEQNPKAQLGFAVPPDNTAPVDETTPITYAVDFVLTTATTSTATLPGEAFVQVLPNVRFSEPVQVKLVHLDATAIPTGMTFAFANSYELPALQEPGAGVSMPFTVTIDTAIPSKTYEMKLGLEVLEGDSQRLVEVPEDEEALLDVSVKRQLHLPLIVVEQ